MSSAFWSAGTSFATGLPCFVITTLSLLAWTSSITARQCTLKTPAAILFILNPCDHSHDRHSVAIRVPFLTNCSLRLYSTRFKTLLNCSTMSARLSTRDLVAWVNGCSPAHRKLRCCAASRNQWLGGPLFSSSCLLALQKPPRLPRRAGPSQGSQPLVRLVPANISRAGCPSDHKRP